MDQQPVQRADSDLDNANAQAVAQADAASSAAAPAPAEPARTPKQNAALTAAAQSVVARMAAQPATTSGAAAPAAQTVEKPTSPGFLRRIEHAIEQDSERVVQEAKVAAGGTERLAIDIGQHLEVYGGEAVGVAELAGVRYPVKPYEAQVDDGLYRGSRLDDAGMAALKQQGVKGVVSLCLEHTEDAALAAKYGLDALNVKILDNSAPTIAQMNEFIEFTRAHAPSYVHCEAGQGRTGTAVACYRIAVDGWTAERAIAEGRTYGLSLVNQIAFIHKFAESVHGAVDIADQAPATETEDASTPPGN